MGVLTMTPTEEIIHEAAQARAGRKEFIYRFFVDKIKALKLPESEYEQAINNLCNVLEY